jgi:hypothetical protein
MSRDVHITLLLALICPGMAFTTDILVGGRVGWGLGVVYDEVMASVGDVLVGGPIQTKALLCCTLQGPARKQCLFRRGYDETLRLILWTIFLPFD